MEKICASCRKSSVNNGTGNICEESPACIGNNRYKYLKWEPIETEKECCDCKSNSKQGCKRFSKGECSSKNNMYFEPIEPKPKPKADDYEILKPFSFKNLYPEICHEGLEWHKKFDPRFSETMKGSENVLETMMEHHPDIAAQAVRFWIKNGFIKKKERKPEVGGVWRGCTHSVIVIKKEGSKYTYFDPTTNTIFHDEMEKNSVWKYIGKLSEMIVDTK